MMRRATAGLLAALTVSCAATAAAQPAGSASSLPLLDVPYVSQGELLCGGAAAAMLIRAAGARGVYAEDFEGLVDAAAGGIHTKALAGALRARGYGVEVLDGTARLAQEMIAARRPVMALVQDRPGRFHYVVIVGWSAGRVVFHDPARAPFLTRPEGEFDRAWAAAGRWMLVIRAAPSATDALLKNGNATPDASAELQAATARFVHRDYAGAARLASDAIARDPDDRASWRLLGASRYLLDDSEGALDAWNRAGDPKIDLVRIEGLSRTPHRSIEHLMALRPGTMLTRTGLVRANRRLALLPSRVASRVTYIALPGNLAEVRGAIVERPFVPSRLEWIATGARAGIDRELSFSLANLASSGDRLTGSWRFWDGRPGASAEFAFPSASLGGIAGLSVGWQQEHYATAPMTEAREALAGWTNWVTARIRVAAKAGVADWTNRGRAPIVQLGAEVRPVGDVVAVEFGSSGVPAGSLRFATTTATLRWRATPGGMQAFGVAAVAHASTGAPMDRWPGAGSGPARPFLLRAHPLVHEGRIDGEAFGRTLVQASVELQRDVARRGLASLGVATFVDAARAWERADNTDSTLHVDVGAGLRVRLAPGYPTIRLDFAHGLRDGRNAVSAGWQLSWFTNR